MCREMRSLYLTCDCAETVRSISHPGSEPGPTVRNHDAVVMQLFQVLM